MRLKTVTSTLDRWKRWENGKLLSFSCSCSVRSTLVSTNPARVPSSVPKRVRIRGLDCCRFGSEFMNSGFGSYSSLDLFDGVILLIMWCWFEDLVCVWSGKFWSYEEHMSVLDIFGFFFVFDLENFGERKILCL